MITVSFKTRSERPTTLMPFTLMAWRGYIIPPTQSTWRMRAAGCQSGLNTTSKSRLAKVPVNTRTGATPAIVTPMEKRYPSRSLSGSDWSLASAG